MISTRPLDSVTGVLRVYLAKVINWWTARRIAGSRDYVFTVDYVGERSVVWEKYLAEFKGKANVHLLEIGSCEGGSALWFLRNILTHPSATLICVDPFTRWGAEPCFDHNLKLSGVGHKVRKMKGCSEEILPTLQEEYFHIVYIDGSHRAVNVLMDGVASWVLLKAGGIMIFDDYGWEPERPVTERPQMAIDLFLKAFEGRYELLHQEFQVILRKM